jgi:hypothetical protein
VECFRFAPRTVRYNHSWGLREREQVRRFVDQSLRVPCEWMQRRMDAAGILTLRAEKAVLSPHPVFSSTSLQKMQQHIFARHNNGVLERFMDQS